MNKFLATGILILLHLYCQQVWGQNGYIYGILTDSLNGKDVPYAQVYNESSKTYATSDSIGNFRLRGRINDTLVILSISYFGKIWKVEDLNKNNVALNPRLYDIEPVIISTPKNYKQFKKEFLEIEPERPMVIDGFPRYIPKLIPDLLDTNIIGSTAFAFMHPLTYLYLTNSKEEKSKRKVLYLKQELREQVIIDQKYSREIVQNLTGLKDDELTDFIVFCNFNHRYLFEAGDYEIVEAISQKYVEFKQLQNK